MLLPSLAMVCIADTRCAHQSSLWHYDLLNKIGLHIQAAAVR